MAKFYGSDRAIIRDALSLLKSFVTKERDEQISNLPRNGKGLSNSSSEAAEKSFIDRLNGIDSVLENLDNPPQENSPVNQKAPLSNSFSIKKECIDEEPYLNPFTGLMVYPPSANAPGPSGSRNVADFYEKDFSRSVLDKQSNPTLQDVTYSASMPNSSDISTFVSSATESNISTDFSIFGDISQISTISSFMEDFEGFYQKQNGNSDVSGLVKDDQNSLIPATVVAHAGAKEQVLPTTNTHTILTDDPVSLVQYDQHPNLLFAQDLQIAENEQLDQFFRDQEIASVLHSADSSNVGFLDRDTKLAMELAGDTPQTWNEFFAAQEDIVMQEQRELQAIQDEINRKDQEELRQLQTMQDEINRRDQEELVADIARLQAMEDEWNREWEESFRQIQASAQRLADEEEQKETADILNEMKRLQEMFQTEEDRQIDADRRLALSLAEEIGEVESPEINNEHAWTTNPRNSLPPPYSLLPTQSVVEPLPPPGPPPPSLRRQFDQPSSQHHPEPIVPQSRSGWFTKHQTPVQIKQNGPDQDSTKQFQQALKLHEKLQSEWQAEIDKNAKAARAMQKEEERQQVQSRRELENTQRIQRKQQEEEQQRKAAEEARRARMTDCAVCSDSFEKANVYQFPCKHSYCRECLSQSIQTSVNGKKLFQCCKNRVDVRAASRYVRPNLIALYSGLVQELSTPNPVYCSKRNCSKFIPASNVKADTATCPKCSTQTCANCKSAVHTGICKEDKAGQALLQLGKKKHWKKCPHCGTLVERSAGCLHMTCRCGHQFCYRCGKSWESCQSKCS